MKMQDTEKQEKEVADLFLANLRKLAGNRFVGLRYYSTNEGKVKKYNISFGVKKHILGTGRKDEPEFSFIAYDHNRKGYRTFNLRNFKYIKFQDRFFTFDDIYYNDQRDFVSEELSEYTIQPVGSREQTHGSI
jgi:hypothetical protein